MTPPRRSTTTSKRGAILAVTVLFGFGWGCGGKDAPRPAHKLGDDGARRAFEADGMRLVLEVGADQSLHVELTRDDASIAPRAIPTTPMIATPPALARDVTWHGRRLVSGALEVEVDADLCLEVSRERVALGRFCPSLGQGGATLTMTPQPGAGAYGLGQACVEPGLSGGDWSGRRREPGNRFGNAMTSFDGGACGNTQIPILYAVDGEPGEIAIFIDDARALAWDLRDAPWSVTTPSPALRFYLFAGEGVAGLRARYMSLTGRPPVPPRSAFGLWVSEYGYEDWAELEDVLAGLREHAFPVDGFVLDLQWFGGIREAAEDTSMGRLVFDGAHFPDAAAKIRELGETHGVGVIPIEESYVGRALPEHARLAEAGHLVRNEAGAPVFLDAAPWWGKGGMIDWTKPAAADAWHDWKRQPLVELGVVGHWTDLGEPEQFDPGARYHGVAGVGRNQAAVHNLYNFMWAASIARGYERHDVERRPFILSRSGTAGIQRHGVAMWSGDVGTRYTTLASQQRNHMHMALSGVDYYGSDVGGFKREALATGDVGELYTQWFAAAALTEVPLRPHTFNLDEAYETSPDRIGDLESNLAALRLRYALIPYLYSLSHRAHIAGEAVFPPLVLAYPGDAIARQIGDQKLIGRDLLVAIAAGPGQRTRRVYVPAGTWFDFRDGTRHDSRGQWLEEVPLYRGELFALPLYARAGAIVPMQWVDAATMNASGRRLDGTRRDELRVRIFAGGPPTSFALYEDDGETTGYLDGALRETVIGQATDRDGDFVVEIGPAQGSYPGAVDRRAAVVEIVGLATAPATVELEGVELPRHASRAELERASEGWCVEGETIVVQAGVAEVSDRRRFELTMPR